MTIQEAYNKGLDDSENTFFDKFQKLINNDFSGEALLNPKMEELRLLFIDKLQTSDNIDFVLDQLTLIVQNKKKGQLKTKNVKFEQIKNALNLQIDYIHSLSTKKTTIGKYVMEIVKQSYKHIDNL
jgi:hypothetical protein